MRPFVLHPGRSRDVPRRSENVCAGGRVGSAVVLQLVDDVHVTEQASAQPARRRRGGARGRSNIRSGVVLLAKTG